MVQNHYPTPSSSISSINIELFSPPKIVRRWWFVYLVLSHPWHYSGTSAPIGAWKRNFPPFWEIMTKPMQIKGSGNIFRIPCIIDSLIIEQDSCEDTATSECPENFTCSDCQAMIFQHPVVQEGSNEKIRRLGNLRFT